ncbi:MAG: AbiTii domain-containing protein [Thermodesulfobacteriota bacterium]
MSLLREIQSAVVDPNTDVATLLRKCKILAVRLRNEEFKRWVDHELNGYDKIENLPKYRILHTESYGNFSGSFDAALNNAPIPPLCLPEEFRDRITKSYLMHPISAYASLVDRKEKHDVQEQWPASMIALFAGKIYKDMNCLSAWKLIPYNALVALVDTIKTRVLNFILEIEEEAPDAGEAPPNSPPIPQERVAQVFHNHIYGSVGNIAEGSQQVTQTAISSVKQNDLDSLKAYLTALGIPNQRVKELEAAIAEDPGAEVKRNMCLGSRVLTWIGFIACDIAHGIIPVHQTVGANLITQAILMYYGLR